MRPIATTCIGYPRSVLVSRSSCAMLVLALVMAIDASAAAQETDASVHHVTPPPPPRTRAPDVTLDIRASGIVPAYRGGLCPGDHQCVFSGGFGVTVGIERRWPDGWALLARYDVWIVDAESLYAVGLLNSARVGARYVLDETTVVHPYLEALAGFLAFGDTRTVAAAGGSVTVGAGTEIELTESLVLDLDVELWTFATGYFMTRDAVRRSDGFGANLAVQISIGLEVLLGSF